MRIGVLGDTHRTSRSQRPLPTILMQSLAECDLIFHTGDVNARWVLDELSMLASVRAVSGNNDESDLLRDLALEHFFDVGGLTIGLMHGHHPRLTARQYTYDRLRGVVDCAVYGHSHRPEIVERDGLLMVNPGSPTQRRYAPHATCVILDVGETIDARLITLD